MQQLLGHKNIWTTEKHLKSLHVVVALGCFEHYKIDHCRMG